MRRVFVLLLVSIALLAVGASGALAARPKLTHVKPATSNLPFTGGKVSLSATVRHTTKCSVSVSPSLAGFPKKLKCRRNLRVRLQLPINRTVKAVQYTIRIVAGRGRHAAKAHVSAIVNGAAQIAAGTYHTCALTPQETVYCWGSNSEGQLGLGYPTPSGNFSTPQLVPNLSRVRGIYASTDTTCAILASGHVSCWGADNEGQVGNLTRPTPVGGPVEVPGLSGVVSLAMRSGSVCALLTSGRVFCWGEDAASEISGPPTPPWRTGLGAARNRRHIRRQAGRAR